MAASVLAVLVVAGAVGVLPPATRTAAAQEGAPICPTESFTLIGPNNANGDVTTRTVLCNYRRDSPATGLAVTVDYECPALSTENWTSKTAGRAGDPDTFVFKADEVGSRNTGGFTTYAGFFETNDKVFLHPDPTTIVTIAAYGNGTSVYDDDIKNLALRIATLNVGSFACADLGSKPPPATAAPTPPDQPDKQPPPPAQQPTPPATSPPAVPPSTLEKKPLCPEAQSLFDGFSEDEITSVVPPTTRNSNLFQDQASLLADFRKGVQAYNDEHPDHPTTSHYSAPYGGTAGALLWLFSSGGTVGPVAEAYVVGKEQALRDRIKTYYDAKATVYTDAKLTPGDVLRLALELTDGDVNQATLLAHNTLRALARPGNSAVEPTQKVIDYYRRRGTTPPRQEDFVSIGVDYDPKFLDSYLQPLRDSSENGGPWYHLFGMAYFSIVSEGDKGSTITGTVVGGGLVYAGMAGVTVAGLPAIILGVLGALAAGEALVDDPRVANQLEQYYRTEWDTQKPDPEKFCVNVYGALLGYLLYHGNILESDSKAVIDEANDTVQAPLRAFAAWAANKGGKAAVGAAKGGQKIISFFKSPYHATWTVGEETQSFLQGTADPSDAMMRGYAPIVVLPFLEESDTFGAMWVDMTDEARTVTFHATEAGAVLHLQRVDITTADVATWELTAANEGDTFTMNVDDVTRLDLDVVDAAGVVHRPTMSKVLVDGENPFQFEDDTPPEFPYRRGLSPWVWLAAGIVGALFVLMLVISAVRRSKRKQVAPTPVPAMAATVYGPPAGTPPVMAPTGRWAYVLDPEPLIDETYRTVATAVPGAWYEVAHEQDGWVQLRLPDGSIGQIRADRVHRG